MKTLDFIRSNIGNKVYIINAGDLSIDPILRKLIRDKTELKLIRLTPGGMAIVSDDNGKEHSLPPSNIREVGN